VTDLPGGYGFEPPEPEERDDEEQEVLRSWSDQLGAVGAGEPESAGEEPAGEEPAGEPEPVHEPEPALQPEAVIELEDAPEPDEQEVLRSWSDRLQALRAAEEETVVEPPGETEQTVTLPPPPGRDGGRLRRRAKTHRRLVGLKIGASQLAAATVTNNGAAELIQLAREPLASGIVVAGEVREPVELGEALKRFFKKHKLPTKDVRLGIAANRIGVRSFELPAVSDPRQLENAILFRAQEVLPIPVHEAVLDYRILDDEVGEGSPRVLLVVAYRELVDGFLEACDIAGLTLVGIDLEAFALLRALGAPVPHRANGRGARVAVTIGHHRSTVAVTNGSVCEFTRVIDWGGEKLDVAIARALGVTPQEAAPLKHALSLVRHATASTEEQTVREVVLREVHAFTRDLVSSLHFYQSQPGALELSDIALTGGTAHLPGMAEELQRLIGVDVRVADPFGRVRVGKKVDAGEQQIGSLTVAIGLGIED
jgi:type IV pilus assembly protein PilM